MFRLNLLLRRKSEDIMLYAPAPWFRLVFLLLLAVLAAGLIAVAGDESDSGNLIIPIIVGLVCFIAAFYEESWTFDRNKKIIISKFGLIFLNIKKTYSFADIHNFELTGFLRGVQADKSADKEVNLTPGLSREATDEIANEGKRIIHKKWHQELIINLKSGDKKTLEALDSRHTEGLKNKAGILADFCGIPLINKD